MRYEWMDDAACVEIGTEPFFVENNQADIQRAKQICNRCPVQSECLDYALQENSIYGIWGGTTEAERSTIKRRGRRERAKRSEKKGVSV